MKFKRFSHITDKSWVYIIPSIVLKLDDMNYCEKNIAIELHILIWHFRWFWIEKLAY